MLFLVDLLDSVYDGSLGLDRSEATWRVYPEMPRFGWRNQRSPWKHIRCLPYILWAGRVVFAESWSIRSGANRPHLCHPQKIAACMRRKQIGLNDWLLIMNKFYEVILCSFWLLLQTYQLSGWGQKLIILFCLTNKNRHWLLLLLAGIFNFHYILLDDIFGTPWFQSFKPLFVFLYLPLYIFLLVILRQFGALQYVQLTISAVLCWTALLPLSDLHHLDQLFQAVVLMPGSDYWKLNSLLVAWI